MNDETNPKPEDQDQLPNGMAPKPPDQPDMAARPGENETPEGHERAPAAQEPEASEPDPEAEKAGGPAMDPANARTQEGTEVPGPIKLNDHQIGDLNEFIDVEVTDEPDPVSKGHGRYNLKVKDENGLTARHVELQFQAGPVAENGPNGISNEALLVVLIHRLESFQSGPFTCGENAGAIHHLREALRHLQERTRDRQARGVEGQRAV